MFVFWLVRVCQVRMRQRAALLSLYTHGAAAHVDYETAQHRTVLIEAAEVGVVDFVSDLVKWGESVDYETLLGRTALTQVYIYIYI